MSTFIVSNECMHLCVFALLNLGDPWNKSLSYEWRKDRAALLGANLYTLNRSAIVEAYGESRAAFMADGLPPYVFEDPFPRPFGGKLGMASHVAMVKALECLTHQCAEGVLTEDPLYLDLQAHTARLALEIVRALPEYDRAQWG